MLFQYPPAFCSAAGGRVEASTIWTGPSTNYTQPAPHNGSTAAQQDHITSDCWITRSTRLPMYNVAPGFNESSFTPGGVSPANTEWAFGTLADLSGGNAYVRYLGEYDRRRGGGWLPAGQPAQSAVGDAYHFGRHLHVLRVFVLESRRGLLLQPVNPCRSDPADADGDSHQSRWQPGLGGMPAIVHHLGASAAVSSRIGHQCRFLRQHRWKAPDRHRRGQNQSVQRQQHSAWRTHGNYSLTAVATAAGVSATSARLSVLVLSPPWRCPIPLQRSPASISDSTSPPIRDLPTLFSVRPIWT